MGILDKYNYERNISRAYSLAHKGRYEEALDCWDRILNMNPSDSASWYAKGALLYNDLDKYQEALSCFEKALEISPNDEQALTGKQLCQEKLGVPDELTDLLRRRLQAQ